jgi:hypothetical protein
LDQSLQSDLEASKKRIKERNLRESRRQTLNVPEGPLEATMVRDLVRLKEINPVVEKRTTQTIFKSDYGLKVVEAGDVSSSSSSPKKWDKDSPE